MPKKNALVKLFTKENPAESKIYFIFFVTSPKSLKSKELVLDLGLLGLETIF